MLPDSLEKSTVALAVVVAVCAVVAKPAGAVVAAAPGVVAAGGVVVGADVLAVLLLLPHAVAMIESEMIPARTSRRLTGFTNVSPWLGMNNGVTVKIEVDAPVVRR
jgi:hypothetical protein